MDEWALFNYLERNLRLDIGDSDYCRESCPDLSYTKVKIRMILTDPDGKEHDLGSGEVVVYDQ